MHTIQNIKSKISTSDYNETCHNVLRARNIHSALMNGTKIKCKAAITRVQGWLK